MITKELWMIIVSKRYLKSLLQQHEAHRIYSFTSCIANLFARSENDYIDVSILQAKKEKEQINAQTKTSLSTDRLIINNLKFYISRIAFYQNDSLVYSEPNSYHLINLANKESQIIQIGSVMAENASIKLFDIAGRLIQQTTLYQGSTIAYFDTRTVYNGEYIIAITSGDKQITKKLIVNH